MKTLNLGCGRDFISEAVNIDIVDYGGNVVHDLNVYPYPFHDDEFDHIICSHILEHLENFHQTVTELHRISRNGAHIRVSAPFFLNTKFFGDPDHRIPFSIRTFDNYEHIGGRRLRFYERWKRCHRTNYGADGLFKVLDKRFNMSNSWTLKWLNPFVNIEPVVYERLFAGVLSPEEVHFELEVVKIRPQL